MPRTVDTIGRHVWLTKDGCELHAHEMEDSHLRNSLAWTERKLGPELLVFEMNASLGNDKLPPPGMSSAMVQYWRDLQWLRAERDRRHAKQP